MLKRKLAALLAGAMVLTSLPMVSFARTDNNISYVPTVKKDDTTFDLNDAPVLTFEEKGTLADNIDGETIRLTFEGAEWAVGNVGVPDSSVTGFTYTKRSKNMVEITFGTGAGNSDKFNIPLLTKVTADGEAKVTVNPLNTPVSAGTYVFANGGSGSTKTTIADTADFPDELELEAIIIDELKGGSLPRAASDKEIKLTAPRGFEWSTKNVTTSAIEAGATLATEVSGAGAFNTNINTVRASFPDYRSGGRTEYDREVLVIKYNNATPASNTNIGSILLEDLVLTATEDADFGDVVVEVSGSDITEEEITVGKYVEYGVIVEVEDKDRELFSGRYDTADQDDAYKLLELTIKEGVVDSWWAERNTTIEFPEGIKVRDVKVLDDSDKIAAASKVQENDTLATHSGGLKLNKDKDIITLSNMDFLTNEKGKIVLQIWVSIEADFEGDIVATVGGPALPEDTEVTLAKALVPVSATFETTELQIGYKEVAVSDIEITEVKAGALQRGGSLVISPENDGWLQFSDDFDVEVEVTSGDLQLGKLDFEGGAIVLDIKRESKEASTIKISGAGLYLDRSVAEGNYDLELSGDAFLQNNKDVVGDEGFTTRKLVFEDFVAIVTPAPNKGEASGAAVTASFTAGSVDYTVGSEVAAADATPYIDANGRMMVPVKYVAYALGIDPQQVQWDQASKTATIYGDKVINITIGSKELVVGGTAVPMDTEAVVKDGRTFIPIAFAARALGVPYSFDNATKTVTFN